MDAKVFGGFAEPGRLKELGLSLAGKTRQFRIVDVAGDRAVLDPLDGFIDHKERNKEPFARDDRVVRSDP